MSELHPSEPIFWIGISRLIKSTVSAAIIFFSANVFADKSIILGNWEPFSRTSVSITGWIKVDEGAVKWGVPINRPEINGGDYYPCSATYDYVFTPEAKEHKIIFVDKKCDYENMENSDNNKSLVGWQVVFKENGKYEPEAWFNYIEPNGTISGWGIFIHVSN